MSDFSKALRDGHGDPAAVVADLFQTELSRVNNFVSNLPAEIQPAAQVVLSDAKVVLQDAVSWGGTALAAYVSANSDGLKSEVVKLVAGALGKTDPTAVAAADVLGAVSSLLIGIVQHEALQAFGVTIPQPAPLAQVS